MLALRARGVSKQYRLGRDSEGASTLREAVGSMARAVLGRREAPVTRPPFWALKDISFDIRSGERVGILGANGAGKSTLLKILSRITPPTEGRLGANGRMCSLLEVGTGFHPELTGRENIFLNGALLGMSAREIRERFDEIVAFAEVDRFLDTPVKRYSSGMYVRLAFAVAAHLEPDVLVVDEVLAVGDVQFQRKCMGKMQRVSSERGRTILFVSHNMAALRSLCDRALLIESGRLVHDGDMGTAIARYLGRSGAGNGLERAFDASSPLQDGKVKVTRIRLCQPGSDVPVERVATDTAFDVVIDYAIHDIPTQAGLTLLLHDVEGAVIFSSINNRESGFYGRPMEPGRYVTRCAIPGNLLNAASYSLSLIRFGAGFTNAVTVENALRLDVDDAPALRGDFFGTFGGVLRPDFTWSTRKL